MQVIEQETPVGAKPSSRSKLDMFDEPGFTSGPPKYWFLPASLVEPSDPAAQPLINPSVLYLRYKDNPFTLGDSFGSRWDADGGTASFTTSWALEKEEPKEEVTISSIQPIGERYQLLLTQSVSLSVWTGSGSDDDSSWLNSGSPAGGKPRRPLRSQSPAKPGRSSPTPRPSPRTCSSVGRATPRLAASVRFQPEPGD